MKAEQTMNIVILENRRLLWKIAHIIIYYAKTYAWKSMFCEVIELRKNGLRLRPEEWPAPVAGQLQMAQWDSKHTSYHWAPSPAVFAARAAAARSRLSSMSRICSSCSATAPYWARQVAIQRAVSRSLA